MAKTIDEYAREMIGNQAMAIIQLQTQLAEAQDRIKQLEMDADRKVPMRSALHEVERTEPA